MAKIVCEKCDGKGFLEIDETKLNLASLLEPFVTDKMIGFRLKEGSLVHLGDKPNGTTVPPTDTGKEAWPEVKLRLAQIE